VPGNGFSFSIRVGCEDNRVAVLERGDDVVEAFFAAGAELPGHGETVVRVDGAVLAGQIADVAETGQNLIIGAEVFVDGFGSWGSEGPVEMFVAPIPRGRTSAEYNKKGLNCCVTSWRRISDENLSPRIKCGANYINSRVGQREALRNGYDTCIFLNEVGKVAEGPGSCFFMVKGDTLVTPRLTDSVLESITRDTIICLAKEELGLKVEERTIDRTELYLADEAFLCGSAMEITPIYTIDRYEVDSGEQGEITKRLHLTYLDCVRGKLANRMDWLTPIY